MPLLTPREGAHGGLAEGTQACEPIGVVLIGECDLRSIGVLAESGEA